MRRSLDLHRLGDWTDDARRLVAFPLQAIAGGSYAISDTGAIVVRYRMQNIGGFDSEDRVHVFSLGYRHRLK